MVSESSESARAQLIETRRGTWIDESLLPAARRECLSVLREAARKAVGEDTYLPGWISEEVESAELDLDLLSSERLSWRYASAEWKLDEEVWAAIDELRAQGAFEGLDSRERLDLEDAVEERIRSERGAQIAREKTGELLDFVGIRERETFAKNLSYGDQRRLEIARALASDPKLLLLDEPTAGMNPQETARLTELIGRLREERGIAILLIEHEMRVVMSISDRVTVLDHGEKISEGKPSEVREDPKVIEAYLGTAKTG